MTNDKQSKREKEYVRIEQFINQRSALISYMQVMIQRRDWHGVSDAANDLRVLEAENREFVDYV